MDPRDDASPAPAPVVEPGRRRAPLVSWPVTLLLALLVLVGAGAGVAHARGDRFYDMKTPSMGTWAPVGTLLVTRPASASDLHPGQVIVFRNPVGRTYGHRIVAMDGPTGAIRTKGDINGSVDPWTLHTSNLNGAVWFRVPYGGYLMRAMPWLLGGLLVTEALVHLVIRRRWRQRSRFLLGFATIDLAAFMVHPFTGAVAMGFTPATKAGMEAIVVGTGIFPLRVQGLGGTHADVHQGHVGHPVALQTNSHGVYQFTPFLHMSWRWWLGVVVVSLLPLLWAVLHGFDEVEPGTDPAADDEPPAGQGGDPSPGAPGHRDTGPRPRRALATRVSTAVAGLTAALVAVGWVASPVQGGFTARVTNSTNTAGTRQYFTCLAAMQAYRAKSGHNGQLSIGYTGAPDSTGATGTASQATNSTSSLSPTATTSTTSVGCTTDARARSQQAVVLNGTTSKLDISSPPSFSEVTAAPDDSNHFTFVLWFQTTTTRGGVLACLAKSDSTCYDRSLWMGNDGRLMFGMNSSTTIASTTALNDGRWHMAAAQFDASIGMKMWVDGALVASNSYTSRQATILYPQWGYSKGTLPSGFTNQPTSTYFAGSMQMMAVFGNNSSGVQLQTSDILAMYQAAQP